MRRQQVAAAGLLVALLAGLVLYASQEAPPNLPPAAPDAGAPSAAATTTTAATPSTADAGEATEPPEQPLPGRVLLPPVPRSHFDGGLRSVSDLAAVNLPKDKRLQPGPRAQQELEILGYTFETLAEDVDECLAQWDALDAGTPAR